MPTNHPGDIFGLMSMSAAIVPTRIKTFEDDPTLFGETLRRRVSFPNHDLARVNVMGAIAEMRDRLKDNISRSAPRCRNCAHCVVTIDRSEDFVMDAALLTVSATCAKEGVHSTVCPDGQTAVRKGHKAIVDDRPGTTDDLLDAMQEAWKYHSDTQPDITPASPDTPTTLADDAW